MNEKMAKVQGMSLKQVNYYSFYCETRMQKQYFHTKSCLNFSKRCHECRQSMPWSVLHLLLLKLLSVVMFFLAKLFFEDFLPFVSQENYLEHLVHSLGICLTHLTSKSSYDATLMKKKKKDLPAYSSI